MKVLKNVWLALAVIGLLSVGLSYVGKMVVLADEPPTGVDQTQLTNTSDNLNVLAQLGGDANIIKVQGDYAYIAISNKFTIVDISNAPQMSQVAQLLMPHRINHLELSGDYAYVNTNALIDFRSDGTQYGSIEEATIPDALSIINITNPTQPVLSAEYSLTSILTPLPNHPALVQAEVAGMILQYPNLYLVGPDVGLVTLDVSDPANVTQIGQYDLNVTSSFGLDVWGKDQLLVVGNYAFFAEVYDDYSLREEANQIFDAQQMLGSSEINIINLADPQNPVFQTSYTIGWEINSMHQVGNYLYVSPGDLILDISDPTNPVAVNTTADLPSMKGLSVVGNLAYAAGGSDNNPNVFLLDITDPVNPVQIASYHFLGAPIDVVALNNYIWLAARQQGVRLIDFSDVNAPVEVSVIDGADGRLMAIKDNYAYLQERNSNYSHFGETYSLRVVDISDPDTPADVNKVPDWTMSELVVANGYGYARNKQYGSLVLSVIDFSNPLVPTEVYTLTDGDHIFWGRSITFKGNIGYFGTTIVDFSNPAQPTLVGNMGVNGEVAGTKDRYLYVTSFEQRGVVEVRDATNPAQPTLVSTFSISPPRPSLYSNGFDLQVSDNYGFAIFTSIVAAPFESDICMIDFSDPLNPQVLDCYAVWGGINLPGYTKMHQDILYLPAYDDFIGSGVAKYAFRTVDARDATNLQELAFNRHILPSGFQIHNNLIYGSSDRGFYILGSNLGSTVSGKIVDQKGEPFAGAQIALSSGAQTQTDGIGKFAFSFISTGTYTITPTLSGYRFEPPQRVVTLPPNSINQNFTIIPSAQTVVVTDTTTTTVTYLDTQGLATILEFPAGAVTANTQITVNPTRAYPTGRGAFTNHAFDVSATQNGQPVSDLTFTAAAQVTIAYSDDDIDLVIDEGLLTLQVWDITGWEDAAQSCLDNAIVLPEGGDTGTGTFVLEPYYQRDLDANTITVATCRTGLFVLTGPTHSLYLPLLLR